MIAEIGKVLLHSYRLRYGRVLLVVMALVAATAGLSAVLLLNQTASISYEKAQQPFLQQVNMRIVARDDTLIEKAEYAALRRAGFTALVPVFQRFVPLPSTETPSNGRQRYLNVLGIDLFAVLSLPSEQRDLSVEGGADFSLESVWRGDGRLLIRSGALRSLSLNSGIQIPLENGNLLPPLSPIDANGLNNELITDIGQVQKAFALEGISALWVIGRLEATRIQALRNALPEHLTLERLNTGDDAQALTGSFHLNLLAMALLMFIVAMFVVMNALQLLISSRLAMLRTLRQLGVTRRAMFAVHGLEMLLLSGVATVVGVLCGGLLAGELSPAVFRTLQGLYDVRISADQSAPISLFGICFLLSALGSLCAALLPWLQLNKRLALRAVPEEQRRDTRRWLLAGVFLLATTLVLSPYAKSLGASFGLIALIIFAGCSLLIYLLPVCIRWMLAVVSPARALLHWAIADSLRISRYSKIALCAFFIAVAANIGMNLMVDSFRQATHDWLKQRLHAPYYLYSQDNPAVMQTLREAGLDSNLIERRRTDADYKGRKISVSSYPVAAHHRDALVFYRQSDQPWEGFARGDSIFVSQQFAFAHDLTLGQSLSLLQQTYQIEGIYYDYGNTEPAALLPLGLLAGHSNQIVNFALFETELRRTEQIDKALRVAGVEVEWFATPELLELSMETFDRTFEITRSLNIVTLLVAAFSLASSIMLLALDNAPQQSLLMTFGVGKSQLFWLCLGQYSLLSLLVVLIAMPFGGLLSWLLINLVNVQAFFWSYPLLTSWQVFAQVTALALVMVIGAVTLPLYAQRKRPIAEQIKWLG